MTTIKLTPPFFISSALAPAIRVGDCVVSLLKAEPDNLDVGRVRFTFEMQTPGFTYECPNLTSGAGDWRKVSAFESFLAFLSHAASVERHNLWAPQGEQRETPLFPDYVMQWAYDNEDEIEAVKSEICDDSGGPLEHLLEEQ